MTIRRTRKQRKKINNNKRQTKKRICDSSFQIEKGSTKNENPKNFAARKTTVSFGNNSSILKRYIESWKNKLTTLEWTTKKFFDCYQHLYKGLEKIQLNVKNYYEKFRRRCIAAITTIATLLEIIFAYRLIILSSNTDFYSSLTSFLHSDRQKVIILCFLLNKNNSIDHSYLSNILNHRYIFVKRKILRRFLLQSFYDDVDFTFSTPARKDLHFWYECADNLGEKTFLSHVEYYVARSSSQFMNASVFYPEECYGECEIEDAIFYRLRMRFSNTQPKNTRPELNEGYEVQASTYHKSHDPPGQHSVYIPPGDTRREMYRLSTFTKFPSDSPVDSRTLATVGFFYTGYKDRVKCSQCAVCVDSCRRRRHILSLA